MIANGARKDNLSVTGDISIAVDKLANLRAGNMSVSDYLGQMSFMGDELTPNQKIMLKFISEQRQPKRIREFLREYAGLVEKEPDPNQMSLLGDMSRTKEELLNDAIGRIEPAAEGLFAAEAAGEPAGELTPAPAVEAVIPVDELAQPEQGRPGVREDVAGGMEAGSQTLIDANGNNILASELLSKGKEQQAKFLQDLRGVAEETGLTYDPAHEGGSLKSMGRLIEKAGTGVPISDVLRYELTHANPSAKLQDVIAAMKKRGYEVWHNDIDNLFDDPEPGYKHIAIKFTTGTNDPVVKELQILQPKMSEFKHKYGWDYYKVDRELKIAYENGVIEESHFVTITNYISLVMKEIYSFALSLDNPTDARNVITSFGGDGKFNLFAMASNSVKDVLETLRNPASTSLRNSAISSTVDSLVSGLESVISKSPLTDIIQQNARTVFDEGSPLPITLAADVDLNHAETLPEPQNVTSFRDKAESFRRESKTYARQYVDWVLSGERGQAPEAASPLIEQSVINALADSLQDMRLAALEMATAKRTSNTPIPEQGMYVAKVYRFKHGDADIVATVYKDGELVAYLPDNYKTDTFEANKGQARVLGLAPDDPSAKVYEVDGEIKTSGDIISEKGRQILQTLGYDKESIARIELEQAPDLAGKQEPVSEQRIQFSENDVPYNVAYDAHRNMSFVPDERAISTRKDYVAHMEAVQESLLPYADTPEKLAKLQEGLVQYKNGYLKHLLSYLTARSRTASAMIVGPSKFPVERNRAKMDIAYRRFTELMDWVRINKSPNGDDVPRRVLRLFFIRVEQSATAGQAESKIERSADLSRRTSAESVSSVL